MVFGKLENIAFIEASVHGMGVFCTHAINYICLGCVLRSVGTRNDSNLYLRESVLYIYPAPLVPNWILRKIDISPKCAYKNFINIRNCVKLRVLAFKNFGRKCLKIIKIMFAFQ